MPIFNYHCGSCNTTQEYFLNSGQEPLVCSNCDERGKLKREYHGQTFSAHSGSGKTEGDNGGLEDLTISLQCPAGHIHPILKIKL